MDYGLCINDPHKGPHKSPQRGPQGPHKSPQGPHRGPQGPHKSPQGPHRGPQGPQGTHYCAKYIVQRILLKAINSADCTQVISWG